MAGEAANPPTIPAGSRSRFVLWIRDDPWNGSHRGGGAPGAWHQRLIVEIVNCEDNPGSEATCHGRGRCPVLRMGRAEWLWLEVAKDFATVAAGIIAAWEFSFGGERLRPPPRKRC